MSLLQSPASYTSRDFDSLRERLVELARSAFPDWTDFETASFGTMLLEQSAFVGDALSYYLDQLARESRLQTASLRENVQAHAGMLGYRMRGRGAAKADVRLSLDEPPAADVLIHEGQLVRTQEVTDPIVYQLLHDVVIPAGADPPEALGVFEHSLVHEALFDATGFADFEVQLARAPYLDGKTTVNTLQGEFTEAETFFDSKTTDRHFQIHVDREERARVVFGNGKNGVVPTGTLSVTYRTGGGAAGRVEQGRLVVINGSFNDVHGTAVRLSVANPLPSYGGEDRESLASAKRSAPRNRRVGIASAAREDFEIHAEKVSGVGRALMLTSDEEPGIAENSGDLHIVPTEGATPPAELVQAVYDFITTEHPPMNTFKLRMVDPAYLTVDVTARVYFVPMTPAKRAAQAARIATELAGIFALSNEDGTRNERANFGFYSPGSEVAWSDIFDVIRHVVGVRKISSDGLLLNGAAQDIALALREFPALGTVSVIDADSGEVLL